MKKIILLLPLLFCSLSSAFAQIDTGERILLISESNGRGGDNIAAPFLAGGDSACDNMAMQIALSVGKRSHAVEPMRCLDIAGRPRFDIICKLDTGQRTISYSPPPQVSCKRQEIDAQPAQ